MESFMKSVLILALFSSVNAFAIDINLDPGVDASRFAQMKIHVLEAKTGIEEKYGEGRGSECEMHFDDFDKAFAFFLQTKKYGGVGFNVGQDWKIDLQVVDDGDGIKIFTYTVENTQVRIIQSNGALSSFEADVGTKKVSCSI